MTGDPTTQGLTSPPIHPGEILQDEFIGPMGITPYRPAKDIGVPVNRITAIIKGKRAITADTAVRLGAYFGVDPQWWLNMQTAYELGDIEAIRAEVTPLKAAS